MRALPLPLRSLSTYLGARRTRTRTRGLPAATQGEPPHYERPAYYGDVRLAIDDALRKNEERLAAAMEDPAARFIAVKGRTALIALDDAGTPVAPYFLDAERVRSIANGRSVAAMKPTYLGTSAEEGANVFAVEVLDEDHVLNAISTPCRFGEVKLEGPHLGTHAASLLAVATGLSHWQKAASYCGFCGSPMVRSFDGRSAKCSNEACGKREFPRTDPAVITICTAGEYVLLGRNPKWPVGRYSALAGFAEQGETLEQCVCREVLEESGIELEDAAIDYVESQPWPFPRSLMLGFRSTLPAPAFAKPRGGDKPLVSATGQPVPLPPAPPLHEAFGRTGDELEDVRWFHFSYLQQFINGAPNAEEAARRSRAFYGGDGNGFASPVQVPGEHSLARRMIDRWLDEAAAAAPPPPASTLLASIPSAPPLAALPNAGEAWSRKYVLCVVSDVATDESKLVVRLNQLHDLGYHIDSYRDLVSECRTLDESMKRLHVEEFGGGRMRFTPLEVDNPNTAGYGAMEVHGYSSAFGMARHDLSSAILRAAYPFLDVTWHEGGY